MDVKIETAKATDWEVIQELNNQVFLSDKANDEDLDMEHPFSEEGVSYYKQVANGEIGKCFIAYVEGKPAGYIALAIKDFGYRKSLYVEVDNMGVDPEYRSHGIGKLLIEEAVKWAKEQSATKLYVSAYWKNTKGLAFYKKNGFYEIGVELDKDI